MHALSNPNAPVTLPIKKAYVLGGRRKVRRTGGGGEGRRAGESEEGKGKSDISGLHNIGGRQVGE